METPSDTLTNDAKSGDPRPCGDYTVICFSLGDHPTCPLSSSPELATAIVPVVDKTEADRCTRHHVPAHTAKASLAGWHEHLSASDLGRLNFGCGEQSDTGPR